MVMAICPLAVIEGKPVAAAAEKGCENRMQRRLESLTTNSSSNVIDTASQSASTWSGLAIRNFPITDDTGVLLEGVSARPIARSSRVDAHPRGRDAIGPSNGHHCAVSMHGCGESGQDGDKCLGRKHGWCRVQGGEEWCGTDEFSKEM
jgi:hypothetical protein